MHNEQSRLGAKLVERGEAGYEATRQTGIFNARKPDRFPEAIVMAETIEDVQDAVRLARARGLRVGVRSGGHSWVASHTRDGSILINLSRMQHIEIDAANLRAVVSPSTQGNILGAELRTRGLFFPSGHCAGVGIGGFTLCGGHGWNSRVWGPACESLLALDVVTASGDLIHADETQNSDWYWAARGAGPGFFGVAVRLYLNVQSLPPAMKLTSFIFPHAMIEEMMCWVRSNTPAFPRPLEVVLLSGGPVQAGHFRMSGIVLGTEAEAAEALDLFEANPGASRAAHWRNRIHIVVPNDDQTTNPPGFRYAVDNVWLSGPGEEFAPLLRDTFTRFPTPESYAFWQTWGPLRQLPDMAYSVQGDIYVSANAVYADPADDRRCSEWVRSAMASVAHLSDGAQLNDENMAGRSARYFSPHALARLKALRKQYDPDEVLVSFLGDSA